MEKSAALTSCRLMADWFLNTTSYALLYLLKEFGGDDRFLAGR